MIDTEVTSIGDFLHRALQNMNVDSDQKLVSMTKKINPIRPLYFFEAAKKLGNHRIFWKSADDKFILAGAGNASVIIADEHRFTTIETKWQKLLEEAVIHNPYNDIPGTGLVAFGGIAFDPLKTKTKLWNKFEASRFRIPEFVLVKYDKDYYLTINICITKNDHNIEIINYYTNMEQQLRTSVEKLPEQVSVKEKAEIAPNEWKQTVQLAKKEIQLKRAEKIVLAREMRLKLTKHAEISTVLHDLIESQSNSYVFAFEQGMDCFVGATPERLVKVEKNKLLSMCMAGTAPRGKNKLEDEQISERLLHDQKNLDEHHFVVKMIRNSIEAYCKDIQIPNHPTVYPLKNLQHLYTPVSATLRKGYSIFDIIEKLHPTPALGGTPKKESIAFIRNHELLDRGWYGAPIGWMDSDQNGEFAVAIRSGLIQGDEASLFAGCGVVKDSNIEEEYRETQMKFLPMLSVLGG